MNECGGRQVHLCGLPLDVMVNKLTLVASHYNGMVNNLTCVASCYVYVTALYIHEYALAACVCALTLCMLVHVL